MKLKRLIVQGFKSFKDRTTINFDEGITGIVGPNGCGKSNVVDALFWVMGEQSAKHLRGTSMQDLIFSGSTKYGPANWAEVTLVLNNDSEKHIHIGSKVAKPSEIQLTRKIYRNGETEYRINNMPCRLKDIQEVFMDTGAGAKSYSIIAQGEINRLVQSKPQERRSMIEEVAGITKFKKRRRESLKKIENTQSNLNRLSDLKTEIAKNLKALQKQAEKAERARHLKQRVQKYELSSNAHREYDLLKEFRDGKTFINEKRLEVANWQTEKNKLELNLQKERLERDQRLVEIENKQEKLNQGSKELAASEERLNFIKQGLTEKMELLDRAKEEVVELKKQIAEKNDRALKIEEEIQTVKQQEQEVVDFASFENEVNSLREAINLKEDLVKQKSNELFVLKETISEIEQTLYRNKTRQEEDSRNLQDISMEIEALEKQYSTVSKDVFQEREKIKNLKMEMDLFKEDLDQKQIEEKSQVVELEKIDSELSGIKQSVMEESSKLVSLNHLRSERDAAFEGRKEFLTRFGERYQQLQDMIKVEEQYRPSIEMLFRDILEMMISENGNVHEEVVNWITENPKGPLQFIDICSGRNQNYDEMAQRLEVNGLLNVKEISTLVEESEDHKNKNIAQLFAGYFVADNLSEKNVFDINKEIGFKGIVSLDGKTLIKRDARGFDIISSNNLLEEGLPGILEQNHLIEQKTLHLEELENSKNVKNLELIQAKEKMQNLKAELTEVAEKFHKTKELYLITKTTFETKQNSFNEGATRLEILKKRKDEISKSKLVLLEVQETCSKNLEFNNSAYDLLDEEIDKINNELSILKKDYSGKKEKLVEKKIAQSTFLQKLESLKLQREDLGNQIEELTKRELLNQEYMEKYTHQIEDSLKNEKELEENNKIKANLLADSNLELSQQKDDLSSLLNQMQDRENKFKKISADINKTEKELIGQEVRVEGVIEEEEQIVRNIFEKYRVDLRNCLSKYLEFEALHYDGLGDISNIYFHETENGVQEIESVDYLFNRKFGKEVKELEYKWKKNKVELSRIGDINWQAIEDYEKQKVRFDFLRNEEEDLKQSLRDLEVAIEHIDEKSRNRFIEAFTDVSGKFEKVFPIIFGGGNAKLSIVGDIHSPECGVEIHAQPPGKKMQNINLMSGGEKAMTALSLIFSIFLVKPSPFCLLDEVDAPLDDANVGRFNDLLREMSDDSQFILITHNKKTMELNDMLYGITMQEAGISTALSVQLH